MLGRILEVANDNRHLEAYRGFLRVRCGDAHGAEVALVPFDHITAVVANSHGITYSNSLLVRLSEHGIPMAFCGSNHQVSGILWPVSGHHLQGKRFDAQLAATKPLKKRLWAEVVKSKLLHQASVLTNTGKASTPLKALARNVRSGDPDNLEAQGARYYWRALFGDNFRRERSARDQNSLLNYGYAVLRAATGRAVIAAGLHPTVGIHHRNESNSMRLVDDLMEPFRPYVDYCVWQLGRSSATHELDSKTKASLVNTLFLELATRAGATPIQVCLQRLATSLALVLTAEQRSLDLPEPLRQPAGSVPPEARDDGAA